MLGAGVLDNIGEDIKLLEPTEDPRRASRLSLNISAVLDPGKLELLLEIVEVESDVEGDACR